MTLLFPKVNKAGAADVVNATLFNVPVFVTLLKPARLVVVVVLTNNVVPVV